MSVAWLRNLRPNTAVAVSVITFHTTQNPLWWTALVACFVVGYAIARSWSGPPVLWIALLVTGLFPAAWLALFLVIVYKMKQASQGYM